MVLATMFTAFGDDPLKTIAAGGMFMFMSVLMICIFSFISIAVWTEARKEERREYYKAETTRRLMDSAGQGAQAVIEVMREKERIDAVKRAHDEGKKLEGIKIGAVVNVCIGVALWAFLNSVGGPGMVGAFPFSIGVALAVYAWVLVGKGQRQAAGSRV